MQPRDCSRAPQVVVAHERVSRPKNGSVTVHVPVGSGQPGGRAHSVHPGPTHMRAPGVGASAPAAPVGHWKVPHAWLEPIVTALFESSQSVVYGEPSPSKSVGRVRHSLGAPHSQVSRQV